MQKIYIVRLCDDERTICLDVVKKFQGSSQKVRRAHILLQADVTGPNWTDQDIADAYHCTRQCVENVRQRLVTEGFDIALHGKKREPHRGRNSLMATKNPKLLPCDSAIRPTDATVGHSGFLPKEWSNLKSLPPSVIP